MDGDATKEAQRRWIAAVADTMGVSVSALARKAGLAPSTLNRLMNDPSGASPLKPATIFAVARAAGVRPMDDLGAAPASGSAWEDEARQIDEDYLAAAPDWLAGAVRAFRQQRPGRAAWMARSLSLDLDGVRPDDVLLVDSGRTPREGDLVLARCRQASILRRYDKPFLLDHSSAGRAKPLLVDDDFVSVIGVITGSLRAA